MNSGETNHWPPDKPSPMFGAVIATLGWQPSWEPINYPCRVLYERPSQIRRGVVVLMRMRCDVVRDTILDHWTASDTLYVRALIDDNTLQRVEQGSEAFVDRYCDAHVDVGYRWRGRRPIWTIDETYVEHDLHN